MFEQELYNNEVTQVESQKGDLFHNYEIRNWDFSSTIYKILAISAVFNLALLAFIGQANLLTLRGCDSPFVGRVCQVLDMAYVSTVLFGTEREYADLEYEKTELGDAEITFIDVSGELKYPEGYFQIANPVQFAMQQQGLNPADPSSTTGIPGFPGFSVQQPNQSMSMSESELLKLRPQPPAPNPRAFQDDTATIVNKPDYNGTNAFARKSRRGGRPLAGNSNANVDTTVAKTDSNTNTNPATDPAKQPDPSADEAQEDKNGVFINKRPLNDRAKETLAQIERNSLKLDKSFKIVIEGTLGLAKDGKTVVLKNPKPVAVDPNIPNDPEMVKLAQDWVLAVGDAGWLGYLEKLELKKKPNSKKVIISVEQNDTEFVANVRSQLTSPNEANTLASALRNWITLGAIGAKDDELTFLKAATTTTEGTDLILVVKFEKPVVQEMIQRKLAESKEKENKPNGNAAVSRTPDTTVK
jgi:hypothetical protein